MAGFIDGILSGLNRGTRVQIGYGSGEGSYSTVVGTVTENAPQDGALLLQKEDGTPAVVRYRVVQDVSVLGAAPVNTEPAASAYHTRKMQNLSISAPDGQIRLLFDGLPRGDKTRLNGPVDSFFYGIRTSDRTRIRSAAENARRILFDEDDRGYDWSGEAAQLCGQMLCRAGVQDPEVFLVGERFWEAAFCAFCNRSWSDAGVYAAAALLENDRDHREDLLTILAKATVESDDPGAVIRWLAQEGQSAEGKGMLGELLRCKGAGAGLSADALPQYYRGSSMAGELDTWLPEQKPGKAQEPCKDVPERPKKIAYTHTGRIRYLQWTARCGTVVDDEGKEYPFDYRDLENPGLKSAIERFCNGRMNGRVYWIRFAVRDGRAVHIQPAETALQRARKTAGEVGNPDRFARAVMLCKASLDTPEEAEALGEMLQYALEQYKMDGNRAALEAVEKLLLERMDLSCAHAKTLSGLGQIRWAKGDLEQALAYTRQAMACPDLPVRMEMTVLAQLARFGEAQLERKPGKKLAEQVVKAADRWLELFGGDEMKEDPLCRKTLGKIVLHRVAALCALDRGAEAEGALALADRDLMKQEDLNRAEQMILRVKPRQEPDQTVPEAAEEPRQKEVHAGEQSVPVEEVPSREAPADGEEDEDAVLVEPYTDTEGWAALGMTGEEVIRTALGFRDNIPGALAYLKAGAALCPEVEPVYRAAALAADDPMAEPDYTTDGLVQALAAPDQGFGGFRELCMAAAFLRRSFREDTGWDYGEDVLRGSITGLDRIPGLEEICDRLVRLRRETGFSGERWTALRRRNTGTEAEQMDALTRRAEELYIRHVETPPRLDAKMARWIETKRILFGKDSQLGMLLNLVRSGSRDRLMEEKAPFAQLCLIRPEQFSHRGFAPRAAEELISRAWDEAGRRMPTRKTTATPQGSLGNNLRSSVTEVMETIYQWYALEERCSALPEEAGMAAFEGCCEELAGALRAVAGHCAGQSRDAGDGEHLGWGLLAFTAGELADKLAGSWNGDRRKFFYAGFLRSDQVRLDERFLPELDSTFCALEEFNILRRIAGHVRGEKLTLQEHLDRIYGREKQWCNFGTADRILEYAASGLAGETVQIPENAGLFRSQGEKQNRMQLRIFLENYAMAVSCGQIERGDSFCEGLENTVRFWNARWSADGDYGMALRLMEQGIQQIRRSACRYEQQLLEQLDAMADSESLRRHPEYEGAIREQITQHNFLVAEDWMNQARQGRLHIHQEKREALTYLDQFWSGYTAAYNQAADTSRPLKSLMGVRPVRNKDAKGAQQLIDSWLGNGGPTPVAKIDSLLKLLGWKNMKAEPFCFAGDPDTELFRVERIQADMGRETPLHPIADFGSRASRDGMYAACLYGRYDCQRLYAKLRAMDGLDGSKVIFLDYALGSTERRLLAQKLKRRESGLANTCIVIDRVMMVYLANHYNENLISRILMAVAMPFSYCQPYVADSSHTMPPEIFIGRKEELLKIEQPGGVNLIYGGRQLGKSALLKKARGDIDGTQGRRAVLVDLKDCGCAAAARKLCWELMDLGILPEEEVTDDWEILCRRIRSRLRREDDPIRYLLVLLDEADAFIADCARLGYSPLVELKQIQQTLDGRFKFVLAGLHNVVRFNREVALGQNAVITHLPSLKVTPFRPAEAEELLTEPLSYLGFSLPSPVTVSQILAAANYFPGLIQLYCQKLIESVREADYAGYDPGATPPYLVTDRHLRRVMADREFTDQIREKFEITLRLDQDQGNCYYPLALLIGWISDVAPSNRGYSARDVLFHARDLRVQPLAALTEDQVDALMQELQDLNILRTVERDTYVLSSKNFRDLLGSEEEIFEELSALGGEGA